MTWVPRGCLICVGRHKELALCSGPFNPLAGHIEIPSFTFNPHKMLTRIHTRNPRRPAAHEWVAYGLRCWGKAQAPINHAQRLLCGVSTPLSVRGADAVLNLAGVHVHARPSQFKVRHARRGIWLFPTQPAARLGQAIIISAPNNQAVGLLCHQSKQPGRGRLVIPILGLLSGFALPQSRLCCKANPIRRVGQDQVAARQQRQHVAAVAVPQLAARNAHEFSHRCAACQQQVPADRPAFGSPSAEPGC